jgi:hypothetical protein
MPSWLSFQTKALPMNPAPPVTTIILIAPVSLIPLPLDERSFAAACCEVID